MRCIFIYNPKSGKGRITSKIDEIKAALEKKFDEVTLYRTLSQADTVQAAKNACGKYDVLVFSGGDGTFNDIACGVASEAIRPILGYIPSGTVNDIARNLRIPKNVNKALKIILDGNTIRHDVGKVNGTYFMYVVAAGTFTGASYRTKHDIKKIFGRLAYAFDGFKDFLNPTLAKVRITIDDKIIEGETPLILVLNSISVAGIPFNKNGHLNDGKFDIIIVRKGVYNGILNIVRLFLLGIIKLRRKSVTLTYRASNFKIESEDITGWTVDGEEGPRGTIMIENLHNHLDILVPFRKNKRTKSKYFNS